MTRLPAALRWPCGYSYRRQVGYQEWLLPIDFAKREEFAYACEAYGRIRERAKNPAERRRLHPFFLPSAHFVPVRSCADAFCRSIRP